MKYAGLISGVMLSMAAASTYGAVSEPALEEPNATLVLRLKESDGDAVHYLGSDVTLGRPSIFERNGHWPARPALCCFRSEPGPAPWSDGFDWYPELYAARGTDERGPYRAYQVQRGERYHVGVIGPGSRFELRTVVVPEESAGPEFEFLFQLPDLGEPPASTRLSVLVRDALDGALCTQFRVRIEDADTGVQLLSYEEEPNPVSLELPDGNYRVVTEGRAGREPWDRGIRDLRHHGRTEQLIEVRGEQELAIDVGLPRGARLDVHVEGVLEEHDRAAVRERYGMTADTPASEVDEAAAMVVFWLVPEPPRWPEPLQFRWFDPPRFLLPCLLLNTGQLSEIHPAGRYRLEARLPGGRITTQGVQLIDGETKSVTLAFEK